MTQSHEIPERMVEVNGTRKYRVDIQESIREESTVYTYDEIEFPIGIPLEVCEGKVKEYEKQLVKQRAQKYLEETDWVVAKISEATLLGEDTEALKAKYEDILTKRAEAREEA